MFTLGWGPVLCRQVHADLQQVAFVSSAEASLVRMACRQLAQAAGLQAQVCQRDERDVLKGRREPFSPRGAKCFFLHSTYHLTFDIVASSAVDIGYTPILYFTSCALTQMDAELPQEPFLLPNHLEAIHQCISNIHIRTPNRSFMCR